MAEAITQEATPKKVAFMSKPSNVEERIKKDEEELKKLVEQENEVESKKEETKEKEKEPVNAEEKTFKKRYGDLRRHTQQKEKEFRDQINELKNQLDSATRKEIKLPKTEEDLETWAKEYPDVAAIVETIAIKKAKEQSDVLEKRIKQIDEMGIEAKKEKAEIELLKIHPDFAEIREDEKFHQWADEQPKWVQDALYENDSDARSAARAIDLYKADNNISKKETTDKDAAKAVTTKTDRSEPSTDETKSFFRLIKTFTRRIRNY
jgi:chromosome segregation ATPase